MFPVNGEAQPGPPAERVCEAEACPRNLGMWVNVGPLDIHLIELSRERSAMGNVRELHTEAMALAQDAVAARKKGDSIRAAQLAARALIPERIAAEMLPNTPGSEPTRSTLFLSAASLAVQAGDLDAALRLVEQGRAGSPSPSLIADFNHLVGLVTARREASPRARS